MPITNSSQNLKSQLAKLTQILHWFESQPELDVEEGIEKIREAAGLIKASKARLKEIENEFKEIKKDIEKEIEGEEAK